MAKLSRRVVLGGLALASVAPVLAACAAAPPPPTATPMPAKPAAPAPAAEPTKPAAAAPAPPTTAPAAATKPAAAPSAAAPSPAATKPAAAAPSAVKVLTPQADAVAKKGGSVKVFGWTENPPTLDPYLNVSFRSQILAGFHYSRLLRSKKGPGVENTAYQMEGDLAETWKASEDGITWTFNLRKNALWHDKPPMNGRPVTAKDVAWSFERFMKVSPQKQSLDIVAEVTAPDDGTVIFKLKSGFAPFEANIGAPIFWVMPREVIEADGDAAKRIVGSGPFTFEKHDSGVAVTAKRNAKYYLPDQPIVDEAVILIVPDTATQLAGLRAGQLDMVAIPAADLDNFVKQSPEVKVYEWPNLNIPFIYWRVDAPPFNDPRVRQAVSMLFDRDAYIKVIQNGRGKLNNAIPHALSETYLDPRSAEQGPSAKFFKHDPAEAKKLFDAAGFDMTKPITMLGTPGYGNVFTQAIELVHQQLKAGGLNVQLKMQEYNAYIAQTFAGKFNPGEIVFGLETPFTEPHDYLFNMMHPKGTRNHAGVSDPKLTEMIEQQSRTVDKAKRKGLIHDIQRYAGEQMYYAWGTAGMVSYGVNPRVRNFYPISDYGIGAEVVPKIWLDK